jgi:hypothetical protein
MSRFNYKWEHRAGRYNVADPLSRIPDQQLSALTRSQKRSDVGGEERTNLVMTATHTATAGKPRKRKLTPVPSPPWDQIKRPRHAAEAAKEFIKAVTSGKEPSKVVETPLPISSKQRKGVKRVQFADKLGKAKSGMIAGKAMSGKDISAEESAGVTNTTVNIVGKSVEPADNWEQFKTMIQPAVSEYVKTLPESIQQKLKEQNGLWYKDKCVVVPDVGNLRQLIITAHHNTLSAGHFGVAKTFYSLCKGYWWPNMRHDVETHVSHCHQCQTNKPPNVRPAGLLQPLPVPSRKWQRVGMDFIVQLPCTRNGHDAIMVVVDRLSKLVHFIPTTVDVSAAEVAKLFVRHVAKHHGLPESIVTDRDTKFTSKFWQAVMELWGVKSNMTTAFHPEGNAQTERMNRVLEEYLRHFVAP